MKTLAIEGINGSGKTPTIELIRGRLEEAQLKTIIAAPYHLVRDKLEVPDIYPLWETDPSLAVSLLHETLNEIELEANSDKADVLIYDRHWMTAFTAVSYPHIMMSPLCNWFVPTALLKFDVNTALRRCNNDLDETWMNRIEVERYARTYCK